MNLDLKAMAYIKGIKLWKVAETLGMTPESLSRKFRKEVSPEFREQYIAAVEKLEAENVSKWK